MSDDGQWVVLLKDDGQKKATIFGPFASEKFAAEWLMVNDIRIPWMLFELMSPDEVDWDWR
jgi:hypothetical protein